MNHKKANKIMDWLITFSTSIIVFCILCIVLILAIAQMNFLYGELPPPNSTQEWKSILNNSDCKWYNVGCQKLACVIDCQEINKNAGENICAC